MVDMEASEADQRPRRASWAGEPSNRRQVAFDKDVTCVDV